MSDSAARALAEHRQLANEVEQLLPQVDAIGRRLIELYEADGRVLTFGNGGSAADAQHFAAELVGRYKRDRRPLAAMSLAVDPSGVTCIGNDYSFDEVFARQVRAFARPGDVVVGFTTSGRSENVLRGLAAGRERGATTIAFAGGGGDLGPAHADHALVVPSSTSARIQEMHLLLLHLLIEQVDEWAAGEDGA